MFQARGIQPSGGDGVSYFPVAMIKHHNQGQFKEENIFWGLMIPERTESRMVGQGHANNKLLAWWREQEAESSHLDPQE